MAVIYRCDICGKKISGDAVKFVKHGEQHIVDIIKTKHPEWSEKDGLCPKCLAYYKKELKGDF